MAATGSLSDPDPGGDVIFPRDRIMKNRFAESFVLPLSLALTIGCGEPSRQPEATDVRMRTIDNSDLPAMASSSPPTIEEEIPSAIPHDTTGTAGTITPTHKAADLPFVPALSMDPVDGAKVSITTETPMVEHKGRIYYFRSEASQRLFQANPERYLKGVFSRY